MTRLEEDRHTGWSNYETWMVSLWFDNNRHIQKDIVALMDETSDFGAERLSEWVFNKVWAAHPCLSIKAPNNHPPGIIGLFMDSTCATLRRVNWEELTEHVVTMREDFIADTTPVRTKYPRP